MKLEDGSNLTKSVRNEDGYATNDELYQQAMLLFDRVDEQEPIKFISISLMNLKEQEFDEIYDLFTVNKINQVDDIISTANRLLGKKSSETSYENGR